MTAAQDDGPSAASRALPPVPDPGVALVTGATRGIGEAVARALTGSGMTVFGMARTRARLQQLAEEVGIEPLEADLEEPGSVQRALATLRSRVGRGPDVVVNAGGVFSLTPLAETGPDEMDRNWRVNTRGTFLVVREVLPEMIARRAGLLIQIGSVAGRQAFPGNAAYSASKFALRGMHEVLLEEIRGTGVRATLLEPAATDTPIWDSLDPDGDPGLPSRSAMLRPDDVAAAVVFIATRPAGVQIPLLQIESAPGAD